MFEEPMWMYGQWWSILTIHRPHSLQWCARGGLKCPHFAHMCIFSSSVAEDKGTASLGTEPGSVKTHMIWAHSAIKQKTSNSVRMSTRFHIVRTTVGTTTVYTWKKSRKGTRRSKLEERKMKWITMHVSTPQQLLFSQYFEFSCVLHRYLPIGRIWQWVWRKQRKGKFLLKWMQNHISATHHNLVSLTVHNVEITFKFGHSIRNQSTLK